MMSIATEIKHARLRQKQRAFLSPWSDLNGVTMNDCRPGLSGTHLNIGIGRREEGTPLKRPSQYFHSEKKKRKEEEAVWLVVQLIVFCFKCTMMCNANKPCSNQKEEESSCL